MPTTSDIIADLRDDITRITDERDALSTRLDELHEILNRKNAIIRMLAMGDCTAEELGLSDNDKVASSP
jgi:hypothetical protein